MAFTQNYKFSGTPGFGFGPAPLSTGSVQAIDAVSATQNYPLGTRARAVDPVLGEGEFIYAKGVASTAKYDAVTIDADYATTRTVAASKGIVGIAQAAIVADRYGWYQIFGRGIVTIAADVAAAVPAYVTSTAGTVADDIVATDHILGMQLSVGLDAGGSAVAGTTETTAAHQCLALMFYPYLANAV